MSYPHPGTIPSNNVTYTPLQPSPSHEAAFDRIPPSPHTPRSSTPMGSFHAPMGQVQDLQADPEPPYGTHPRFLGRAVYGEVGGDPRASFASSQHTFTTMTNDANSSVYALNPDPRPGAPGSYGQYHDNPSSFFESEQGMPMSSVGRSRYLEEKRSTYTPPRAKSKRNIIILSVLVAIIVIVIAAGLVLYFAVFKPKPAKDSTNGSTQPGQPASTSGPRGAVTGGDGTLVTLEDGTTFTYSNSFGGYWYYDEHDPLNNGARAQSWSPALNETFNYGIDKIRGVNIGGWLTIEPFITPALFEKYLNNNPPPVDEWTLSQAMAADTASGGLSQIENHYKTFITEQDFAEIAGAGLNYVRIPLPYWAIETRDGEPFLPKTAWTYFLKAIKWARKYGIRINLDLHALPGSQNGWNHSGRLGNINMLAGPMGLANAQRSLDYIRIIAEFISQPQYRDVVTMFGITNEPRGSLVGKDALARYYLEAYRLVRQASGTGTGQGPIISFHEGFMGLTEWAGFLPNADRISIDIHPYLAFGQQSAADISSFRGTPCSAWGAQMNASMAGFGLTAAGEFSNAVNDCGLWLNGVNLGVRYEGTFVGESTTRVGSCDKWTDWPNYDQAMKDGLQAFATSSMDALQNWFFWTWKIGNSTQTGKVETPAWSYQLGLQNGWMPADPRSAAGSCQNIAPWQPPLKPYQTGGAGAGQIPAAVSAQYAWPPAQITGGGVLAVLPTYTPTGPVPTLPVPTFTAAHAGPTPNLGNGWNNPLDTAGAMVPIAGCSYLDPWVGPGSPPSPLCPAKREIGEVPQPLITPAPRSGLSR